MTSLATVWLIIGFRSENLAADMKSPPTTLLTTQLVPQRRISIHVLSHLKREMNDYPHLLDLLTMLSGKPSG